MEWKREWFSNMHSFPNMYWKSKANRRKFLDQVAVKLKIQKPSDWGKVTKIQFHEYGGGYLLNNFYRGSPYDCLSSVYEGFCCMFILLIKRYNMEKGLVLQSSSFSNLTLGFVRKLR